MTKTPMYLKFDTELLDQINAVCPKGTRTAWLEDAARQALHLTPDPAIQTALAQVSSRDARRRGQARNLAAPRPPVATEIPAPPAPAGVRVLTHVHEWVPRPSLGGRLGCATCPLFKN